MEASLNGPAGKVSLPSTVLTIGRAPDNQLVLPDSQLSSHHAEVRADVQGYSVVDLNSTNGTFVNEQRLVPHTPRLLMPGDVVRIGTTQFTYEIVDWFDPTVRANPEEYANQEYQLAAPQPPPPPAYQSYPDPQPPTTYDDYGQASAAPAYQQPAYPAAPLDYQQTQSPYDTAPQSYPPPGYQRQWGDVPTEAGVPPDLADAPGAPGTLGAPEAPTRKRSRTGLIIGLVVLLLLVVGGGITAGYFILRSTPEKTLQAYCSALLHSDAQGVFNQLSAHAQSQTSVARIASGFQQVNDPRIGGFKTCTYSNVHENGSSATVTIKFTVGNTLVPPITTNDVLVYENGAWKVDRGQSARAGL